MTDLPDPPSRRDRQQQTRDGLVDSARRVFAEDGYHAASLDRIAREAGYSKGAVYSNFDGKAGLFLAVMDQNLESTDSRLSDPFTEPTVPASTGQELAACEGFPPEATQGFALATLEFIAGAARDATLAPLLHQRLATLLSRYESIARRNRAEDETLSAAEVGTLLAALDQGAGLLLLAGDAMPDPAVFTSGMRRLAQPGGTAPDAPRA